MKMQELPGLLQEVIHSAVEHVDKLNKLFICNNLLEKMLISVRVFRAEGGELERKGHVVAETFVNVMQNTVREYEWMIIRLELEIQNQQLRSVNLEIPVSSMMSMTGTCTLNELHTPLYSLHRVNEDTVSFYDYIKPGDLSDPSKFNEECKNDAALNWLSQMCLHYCMKHELTEKHPSEF
ncbi:hypothetical protein EMCG_05945 [[Emmonsia] crescens]|uniref:Uncharacterized protein n=1 Tax=[Emmonsia] crescens TaxID=73230 RepID=A0A0G2ICP9_9EURO|nr:hypothetical protein EMCG_05945 [Emmonsia crescens UAMH 3008]